MTTLTYPFREADVRSLHAGDTVSVNGTIWTGRDRFHKHFADGGRLPVDFRDGALYHCGPVVVKEERGTGKGGRLWPEDLPLACARTLTSRTS